MELLSTLFGRKRKSAKPYVDAGTVLTHKLVTSLNLPGWKNLQATYSPDELEAIDRRLFSFQKMANEVVGGEVKFHPEIAPDLTRTLAAEALAELAGSEWQYSDDIPTNWKDCVATYLKAWAAKLNPLTLLELGKLLVKAGYRSEAKDTFRVVLLFPTYADIYYADQHDTELVNDIVSSAEEYLQELD